jgi:hypothetical protein
MDLNFWDILMELIKSNGVEGMILGLLVLVFVYLGSFTDLFKDGLLRRIAVFVLSALFSDVTDGATMAESLIFAITFTFSSLAKLAIDVVISELQKKSKVK